MAFRASAIRNLSTVHEITVQVYEGKLSPVDDVRCSLDATAGLSGGIRAFREMWTDRVLQAAREFE